MPSPSDLRNCAVVPFPETFNSAAPTELSVMVAALTVDNVANTPSPKLDTAVFTYVCVATLLPFLVMSRLAERVEPSSISDLCDPVVVAMLYLFTF